LTPLSPFLPHSRHPEPVCLEPGPAARSDRPTSRLRFLLSRTLSSSTCNLTVVLFCVIIDYVGFETARQAPLPVHKPSLRAFIRRQLTSLFSTTSAFFGSFTAHKQRRKSFVSYHFRTFCIKHPGGTYRSNRTFRRPSSASTANFFVRYNFRTFPKKRTQKIPLYPVSFQSLPHTCGKHGVGVQPLQFFQALLEASPCSSFRRTPYSWAISANTDRMPPEVP
jgi:hypothetical protein